MHNNLCKLGLSFVNVQYMRKIVLISPICNIWARFAQKCTYFPKVQYIHNICARLYFFFQCTIYVQDCTSFPNVQYMHKICARLYLLPYVQYMCKIVLTSPMHNICARLCFSLPMCSICTRLQALLEEICHISHICSKFRMVFTS